MVDYADIYVRIYAQTYIRKLNYYSDSAEGESIATSLLNAHPTPHLDRATSVIPVTLDAELSSKTQNLKLFAHTHEIIAAFSC